MQPCSLHERLRTNNNIDTKKSFEYVLNFNWHNLKVNLIQWCLVVCCVVSCQFILSEADYMRETGSHLDHLDLPKTSLA